ncbi:MAG TPA: pyridoxamine 5'-phosphate oxidase [Steroidobacteraceae bacterium]
MSNQDELPSQLPPDPMPLVAQWFEAARARKAQPNPDAMVLATATVDGRPSARVVLLKHLIVEPGYVVFFTNYDSRKARELDANPRAAAAMHWDALGRQVRLEGPVRVSPADESDAYFASRPLDSRIGAWASLQSEPLTSRQALLDRVADATVRFGDAVPRPPRWGGFRLWPESVELWVEGAFRVHDRARWTRVLAARDSMDFTPGTWRATRLYP